MATIKQTLAEIRATGLKAAWLPDTREYRVGSGGGAYFTDSADDAVATAKALAGPDPLAALRRGPWVAASPAPTASRPLGSTRPTSRP